MLCCFPAWPAGGERDKAAGAADPEPSGARGSSSCWNWAGWLRCGSFHDVDNWVLNVSFEFFLHLKDNLHLLLSRIFLLNKHEYITKWSNSSAPRVSGIILVIALITWKRLVESFFGKLKCKLLLKRWVFNVASFIFFLPLKHCLTF